MTTLPRPLAEFASVSLLAGELLGYPLEAAARLLFLRRSMEEAAIPLAPVTLRLPGDEDSREQREATRDQPFHAGRRLHDAKHREEHVDHGDREQGPDRHDGKNI